MKKDTSFFMQEVAEICKDEFEVIGEYKRYDKKILIKHNSKECQRQFSVTPQSFLNNPYCPKCEPHNSSSKGENFVKNFLQTNKIKYVKQYKFDDCKNIKPLPFDFAIVDDNNMVLCLIEYDGRQHYEPVTFNGMSKEKAYENFIYIINNDITKTSYCYINKIPLIRISHHKFKSLNTILREELTKLNIISKH